jgi:predicted  nucleic acid-binding Zn-ribbon protein
MRMPVDGFMKELLPNLLKLQSLEFGEIKEKDAKGVIAELRTKIPPPILLHYDRLVGRGKKGVAIVRDQVCTGCHMRLPMGVIMTLMHARDIQICDTCGRYLYLPPATITEAPAPAPTAEPKMTKIKKPRKKKST